MHSSKKSFSFGFPASNNEAEYESLIAGLRLAKAVKAKRLSAYCNSQLVASQFSGDYDARNDRMDAYLKVVQTLANDFEFFELTKVPRGENICTDALTALGSKLRDQVKRTIPIHRIEKPSIDFSTSVGPLVNPISETPHQSAEALSDAEMTDGDEPPIDWGMEFIEYYVVLDDELHRITASKVLLKCVQGDELRRVMAETHGAGGNHSGGRALALKVRNLGFF